MKKLFIKLTFCLILLLSTTSIFGQRLDIVNYECPNWVVGGNKAEYWSTELARHMLGTITIEFINSETILMKWNSNLIQLNLNLYKTTLPRLYIGTVEDELVVQVFVTPKITTMYIMLDDTIVTFFVASNFKY